MGKFRYYGYLGFGPIFDLLMARSKEDVRQILLDLFKRRREDGTITVEPWNPGEWEQATVTELTDFLRTHIPHGDWQANELLSRCEKKLRGL